MKKILLYLLGLLLFFGQATAQTTSIAKWKDNASGAYNIIHDDYGDSGVDGIWRYADTIASNRGIKFTFGAISNPSETRTFVDVNGYNGPYEYAKHVMMAQHNHEIISHSHTHSCAVGNAGWSPCDMPAGQGWGETGDFADELVHVTNSIETNTGHKPQYYIFPYDRFTNAANTKLKELGYIGSRTGWSSPAGEWYFRNGYDTYDEHSFAPDGDGFFRTAVVVNPETIGGETIATQLTEWAQFAIDNGVWVNRELHNVGTSGWGYVAVDDYRDHLDFVQTKMNSGELFVGTISEILTYQIQKLNYTPTASYQAGPNEIEVNWNTPAFDVQSYLNTLTVKSPITLNVDITQLGTLLNIDVIQNGQSKTFNINGNTLSTNIYPHDGKVTIAVNDIPCTGVCIMADLSATNTTINEGENTTLSIAAMTDQGSLTYSWFLNGNSIVNSGNTLTINNATVADAGTYTVTVSNGIVSENSAPVNIIVQTQTPYNNTRHVIPGIIEAWQYDEGGEGLAYNDFDSGNNSNSNIRNDNVDIGSSNDPSSNYAIGYNNTGDWLEYSSTVTISGTYRLDVRVASDESGKFILQDGSGTNISNETDVNWTGGWTDWETVSSGQFHLDAGDQIFRFLFSDQFFDVTTLTFVLVQADLQTIDFTASSIQACLGTPITFTDASNFSGTTYSWDFDDGITKSGIGPHQITYTQASQKNITLTIDGTSEIKNQFVNLIAPPIVDAGSNESVCSQIPETRLSGTTTSGTVSWSGGSGQYDNDQILTPTYTPLPSEVSSGSLTFTLIANNGTCPAVSDQVTITYDICSGLPTDLLQQIIAYPNPFTQQLTIDLSASSANDISWQILSVEGKVLSSGKANQTSGKTLELDTDHLTQGLYIIQLQSENNLHYIKVEKK